MQLAIFIAILMLVRQNNFAQIKPIIEQFGGEEGKLAIKQAEELNQIISTVQTLTSPRGEGEPSSADNQPAKTEQTAIICHPLDPIKGIADERTLSALATVIALGE